MKVTLEDFVPYDQSIQWLLHDAYFERRGAAAWSQGEIPHYAATNYAIARQHAQMCIALFRELERAGRLKEEEPIRILEVGAGSGQFAANFFRALRMGCGPEGRRWAGRVHYVLSDYSRKGLDDAVASHALRPLIAEGVIEPALLDLRLPNKILGFDGVAVAENWAVVLSNYVCCVTPIKLVRKAAGEFFEKFVRIEFQVGSGDSVWSGRPPESILRELLSKPPQEDLQERLEVKSRWQPVALKDMLSGALHAAVIERLLDPFKSATVNYPYVFLDFVQSLRRRLRPGGMILINDYGSCDIEDLEGEQEWMARYYVNTLNHDINFALFDALTELTDLSVERTEVPLRAIHTAALRFQDGNELGFRKAFRKIYVEHEEGEDLLEFGAAAQLMFRNRDYGAAVRFYQRCHRLDSGSPEILFRLGESCVEGGFHRFAVRYLTHGAQLDEAREFDFDFQLGRAFYGLRRYRESVLAYHRSLVRDPHPTTYSNLGLAYEQLGEHREAYLNYRKALELDPRNDYTRKLFESLKTKWLEEIASEPET